MLKIRDSALNLQAFVEPTKPSLYEEINRGYQLSFAAYVDDNKSSYITQNSIVDVDDQYFDIAQLQKSRSGAKIVIDAICEHVSYRLIDNELDYFTADGTAEDILAKILDGTDLTVGVVEI